jgi:hypothetical protein
MEHAVDELKRLKDRISDLISPSVSPALASTHRSSEITVRLSTYSYTFCIWSLRTPA